MMIDIAERKPDKDTKLRWIRRDLGKLSSQLYEIKTKMNNLLEELDECIAENKTQAERAKDKAPRRNRVRKVKKGYINERV